MVVVPVGQWSLVAQSCNTEHFPIKYWLTKSGANASLWYSPTGVRLFTSIHSQQTISTATAMPTFK